MDYEVYRSRFIEEVERRYKRVADEVSYALYLDGKGAEARTKEESAWLENYLAREAA